MNNDYLKLPENTRFPLLYKYFVELPNEVEQNTSKKINIKKWRTDEYNTYQYYKPISKIIPLEDD